MASRSSAPTRPDKGNRSKHTNNRESKVATPSDRELMEDDVLELVGSDVEQSSSDAEHADRVRPVVELYLQ